jgi:acyl dehydratase
MTVTTTPLQPASTQDLLALVGRELGPTMWWEITQSQIDRFADLTGDHQWIHIDPDRARAGEFGGTIAHGLFVLALGPHLLEQLVAFAGFAHTLNYGYDKVRFTAPTPVNSRVRLRAVVDEVRETRPGTALVTTVQTFEVEGGTKPVCVARSVGMFTERHD